MGSDTRQLRRIPDRPTPILVSVIIPTLNEALNIRSCVEAARRGYRSSEVEIIVSDGGSTDRTVERVPEGARAIDAPRGRAVQMNRGADAARGDILVFCHADSRLPAGWREAVIRTLARPRVSGGAFQVRFEPQRGPLLWLINHIRFPADWRVVHGDRAQFMYRTTFRTVGGFPELPLMEDIEMARALHRRGRIALVPDRIVTSSIRYLQQGSLVYLGRVIWNVLRYLYLGSTADDIARNYAREHRKQVDGSRSGEEA